MKAHGKVDWGWLGVAIQNITPPIAKSLDLDPTQASGALIASVVPDSPAAKAGLKSGDVVTAAGGHTVLLLVNRGGTSEFVGLSIERRLQPPRTKSPPSAELV